jgi:hypothetical protein
MTDIKLGASGHWLGNRTGAAGTATPGFWPQPMAQWTTGNYFLRYDVLYDPTDLIWR